MDLTDRQHHFFDYLRHYLHDHGRAPSLRQAAADLGISHTAVAQLIGQLEKKGIIARQGRYSRSIRILPPQPAADRPPSQKSVPIVGRITAGLPIYAQQEYDGSVLVDATLFPGDNLFCLRIQGDSMQGAGILDNDLVICRPRRYAENGEIVAVLIQGEEATVKRFFREGDQIELRPENDLYPPGRYCLADILIQGKVIGVIRADAGAFGP